MEDALDVKLPAFSGPLELLLHLIEKNKVSIYDIPIAVITDQYMAYLDRPRYYERISCDGIDSSFYQGKNASSGEEKAGRRGRGS